MLHECFDHCQERGFDQNATYVPDFGCAGLRANEKIETCADLREKVPDWASGPKGWRPDLDCPDGKEPLFDAVSGKAYCGTPDGLTPAETAREEAGGDGPLRSTWEDEVDCPKGHHPVIEGPTGEVSCEPN